MSHIDAETEIEQHRISVITENQFDAFNVMDFVSAFIKLHIPLHTLDRCSYI